MQSTIYCLLVGTMNIIIMAHQFPDIQYPRAKNILHNLNNLFDRQPIKIPEKFVSERFVPMFASSDDIQSNNARLINHRKTVLTNNNVMNVEKNIPLSSVKAFNNHIRSVSCHNSQKPFNAQVLKQQQQQLRKEKMKALLSVGNMRRTLSNNRKIQTSQTYRHVNRNTQKQDINFNINKNLHTQLAYPQDNAKNTFLPQDNSSNKFANFEEGGGHEKQQFNQMRSTHLEYQSPLKCDPRLRYSSTQLHFSSQKKQTLLSSDQNMNQVYDYQVYQPIKKQYLKKGSSINKGVLNSIIKLKLSKNHRYENDQDIKNQQILKMIKVYKGTISCPEKQKIINNNLNKIQTINKKDKQIPLIMGWQNQTEEFNVQ